MKNILIFGASGHAKVVIDCVERVGLYRVVGIIDPSAEIGGDFQGYPVLGREEDVNPAMLARNGVRGGLVAIGDNFQRARVVAKIRETLPDFNFVIAIHPSAQLAKGVTPGSGTVVLAGAVINSGARVGAFCTLNTGSILEHDAQLGDYASLAPGAIVGGQAQIGEHAAICLGAKLIHQVHVGEHSVIGANATVLNEIPPSSVAYGTPAQVVRSRQPGEKYL